MEHLMLLICFLHKSLIEDFNVKCLICLSFPFLFDIELTSYTSEVLGTVNQVLTKAEVGIFVNPFR